MADKHITEFNVEMITEGRTVARFSFYEPLRKMPSEYSSMRLRQIVRERLKEIMIGYRDWDGEGKPFRAYRITCIIAAKVFNVYVKIEATLRELRVAEPTIDLWECVENMHLAGEDDGDG